MNRRKFIALASTSVAVGAKASTIAVAPPIFKALKRKRAPNVILMICDDLGFGDLGCYGSKLPTPNLDAVAASGVRFTRLNAGHPICSASRAALLTGRYGLRSNTAGAFGPKAGTGAALNGTLLADL